MDRSARHRLHPSAGWFPVLVLGLLVVALVAVGAGVGGDEHEWFAAGGLKPVDRQAAVGTGGNNSEGDIGNAIAGSCTTRFDYREIRLRIEVPPTSQQGVTVDLNNVPGASRTTVEPGTSRVWALDKGAGHCRFAGPEGTLVIDGSEQRVSTREGYTSQVCFSKCTAVDGSVAGTAFSLKQGGSLAVMPYVVVTRPDDPESKIAQIDLRIDVVKISPPIRSGR